MNHQTKQKYHANFYFLFHPDYPCSSFCLLQCAALKNALWYFIYFDGYRNRLCIGDRRTFLSSVYSPDKTEIIRYRFFRIFIRDTSEFFIICGVISFKPGTVTGFSKKYNGVCYYGSSYINFYDRFNSILHSQLIFN